MALPAPFAIIVGGSVSGLIAGLALTNSGFRVEIVEKRKLDLETVDNGFFEPVYFDPESLEKLKEWGVDDFGSDCQFDVRFDVRCWDGRLLRTMKLPGMMTQWQNAVSILQSACAKKNIQLCQEKECVGFSDVGWGVVVTFADGSKETADVVLGADGIDSTIREKLLGPTDDHYLEMIEWSGSKEDNGVFAYFNDALNLFMGRGCHAVVFRNPKNVVSWAFYAPWDGEVVPKEFPSAKKHPQYPFMCQKMLAEPPAKQLSRMILESTNVRRSVLRDKTPVRNWCFSRVGLIGFAAHASVPHLFSGANEIVHDAASLLQSAKAVRIPEDVPTWLRKYQEQRLGPAGIEQLNSRKYATGRMRSDIDWSKAMGDDLTEHNIVFDK